MIASAGAGPEPIPYQALNSERLVLAISTCLEPKTRLAAAAVADRMKSESGLEAAIDSFHRHLPRNLGCDIFPNEPAVWKIRVKKRKLKFSKRGASTLIESSLIREKRLKQRPSRPLTIEPKRWDPLSAIMSATLHAMKSAGLAASRAVTEPYKEYRQAFPDKSTRKPSSSSQDSLNSRLQDTELSPLGGTVFHSNLGATSSAEAESSVNSSKNSTTPSTVEQRDNGAVIRSMGVISGKSLGEAFAVSLKGIMADLPLAAAEGLLAVPRNVSGKNRNDGPVIDWKSGGRVAAKTLTFGVYDGFTDIFVEAYQGKIRYGAKEVAKGLIKGVLSMATKTSAGVIGLVANPTQGAYKSIRASIPMRSRDMISGARGFEGKWMVSKNDNPEETSAFVVDRYNNLILCA